VPGNRNWFILPALTIEDASYVMSWKSAPLQVPRYMDGYQVLVSTTNNLAYETPTPFTDTLFTHASMLSFIGDGQNIHLENFIFTPGYIHADTVTDWTYLELYTASMAGGDTTTLRGRLEPHSVSLSQYAGQTIYIAFLHDSDDDYYISIDDIVITRGNAVGTHEAAALELNLRTFPNPADDVLHAQFRLAEPRDVAIAVTDAQGRKVAQLEGGHRAAGDHAVDLDLTKFPAGAYVLTLRAGATAVSRVFVKR
jgi:hypothetical protein